MNFLFFSGILLIFIKNIEKRNVYKRSMLLVNSISRIFFVFRILLKTKIENEIPLKIVDFRLGYSEVI